MAMEAQFEVIADACCEVGLWGSYDGSVDWGEWSYVERQALLEEDLQALLCPRYGLSPSLSSQYT